MKNEILSHDLIAFLEDECRKIKFGLVRLEIFLRDGNARWEFSKTISSFDGIFPESIDTAISHKIADNEGGKNG